MHRYRAAAGAEPTATQLTAISTSVESSLCTTVHTYTRLQHDHERPPSPTLYGVLVVLWRELFSCLEILIFLEIRGIYGIHIEFVCVWSIKIKVA